ncbi:hypothetical protein [Kitasatospora sp. McL0602]|uniref:hypothetical protein n=1 Tax=Kitasatospora sp. McL0602 TaxID=3439530 RepID=UPI003F8C5317
MTRADRDVLAATGAVFALAASAGGTVALLLGGPGRERIFWALLVAAVAAMITVVASGAVLSRLTERGADR